ncbi:MAG: glycosyltransferase family 4 protein [Chitinophagaceae bacterium]
MKETQSILFFRAYPGIDGTITLIIRLGKELKKRGWTVYFLLHNRSFGTDLVQLMEEFSQVIYSDELDQLQQQNRLPEFDYIHAMAGGDALIWIYGKAKKKYFSKAAIVFGIYHPRAYVTLTYLGRTPDTRMMKHFLKSLPASNLTFMNNAVREAVSGYFGIDFSKSRIIPIPISVPDQYRQRESVDHYKIVSIGRLVEFKDYINPVIGVIKKLREKGSLLEYHVYGGGPLLQQIQRNVADLEAGDYVHIHGELPYSQFTKVVEDAHLFIGMGTAILEASALGIPSLLAIESNGSKTYGWFFDQQGYEVGEVKAGETAHEYDRFIEGSLKENVNEYAANCIKSWQKARSFSIESIVDEYIHFLESADKDYVYEYSQTKQMLLKLKRQLYKWDFLIKNNYKHR